MREMPTLWQVFQRTFFILIISLAFSACTSRLNGGLQVLSGDTPASVYLDGKFMERTPYVNKELKPADYTLEIRPDDTSFVPYQTKVSLKHGMLTVVNWKPGHRPETSGGVIFETEPLRDKKATELVITTIPDGGIIYVDGEAKGFAPATVQNLSKGEHQFEVRLPSYETQIHPINILEGYRILVTVKLGKQDYQAPRPSTVSASPVATVSASPPSTVASTSAQALAPPKVVISKTNFFFNGKEVLRVRSDANASADELGYAPVGNEYRYLQESKEGWVKIQFDNQVGWVSRQFVSIIE